MLVSGRVIRLLFFLVLLDFSSQGRLAVLKTTVSPGPIFNETAYLTQCLKDDFAMRDVCQMKDPVLKQLGEDFDTNFIQQRVLADVVVDKFAMNCKTGNVCKKYWDQMAVDTIKIDWRDKVLRRSYCKVTPCLSAMIETENKIGSCPCPERELTFKGFNLMCHLTETLERDDNVMACLDSAVELFQYNAADLKRNQSSVEKICNCSLEGNTKCPPSCKMMVKKYFCLSQRCSIDTQAFIEKFPLWAWYFQNEDALRKFYKLQSCDEESINLGPPPFVVAVIEMNGLRSAAIVAVISIIIVCGTLLMSLYLYRRYYRPNFTRNRREYTEMKTGI